MQTLVVTTTWNSGDLIRIFLSHYRNLGVDRVLVMDFHSTDGTREELESAEWKDFVEMVPFPGIARLDSSNLMLALAAQRRAADDWCLYCDPDELLVTPAMRIDDLVSFGVRAGAGCVVIPRFNVTAPRSIAVHEEGRLTATDALVLRIDARQARNVERDTRAQVLTPAWVFTAIMDKVFVRLGSTLAIGEGDHSARTIDDGKAGAPDGIYLLHYPFRGYARFKAKVEMARIGFAENPHLQPGHGWQVRRWIWLADAGDLRDEYFQQFIADDAIEGLIRNGVISRDQTVPQFHRQCHATRALAEPAP